MRVEKFLDLAHTRDCKTFTIMLLLYLPQVYLLTSEPQLFPCWGIGLDTLSLLTRGVIEELWLEYLFLNLKSTLGRISIILPWLLHYCTYWLQLSYLNLFTMNHKTQNIYTRNEHCRMTLINYQIEYPHNKFIHLSPDSATNLGEYLHDGVNLRLYCFTIKLPYIRFMNSSIFLSLNSKGNNISNKANFNDAQSTVPYLRGISSFHCSYVTWTTSFSW